MSTTTRITDWVSFTLNHYTDVRGVLDALGLQFLACERGMNGYRGQFASDCGSVRVLFDGSSAMGVHVQISGGGCRLLEAVGVVADWSEFVAKWLEMGANFTRLDLALDCFDPAVSIDFVKSHIYDRSLTTRWKQVQIMETINLSKDREDDGWLKGAGVYFGSKSSDMRLRIYDKKAERVEKGLVCKHEAWTRFEYQARDADAQRLAVLIGAGNVDGAYGVLRSYLEFREYRLASNPSMAPVAAWWSELLGVGKLIVKVGEFVAESVVKLHNWFERQIAPALAVLIDREVARGGDVASALKEYADVGRLRWRERHRLMVAACFDQEVAIAAV